jgi:tyrosine-protein phosphatase SIW14
MPAYASNARKTASGFLMRRIVAKVRGASRMLLAIAALGLLLSGQEGKATPKSGNNPAIARRLTIEGVPNAGEVTPNLYRGGVPSQQGLQNLAKMKINIIVDLRGTSERERKEATALGMEYVPLPWHCPFPRDATFARFLRLLRANSGKKTFVHCRLGDDRVGMMIAAYRMAEEGWTPKQAMREMEAYGFAFSHRFICPSLAAYEADFPKHLENNSAFEGLREGQKLSAP